MKAQQSSESSHFICDSFERGEKKGRKNDGLQMTRKSVSKGGMGVRKGRVEL